MKQVKVLPTRRQEVANDIVANLEAALEMAERGELSSVAIIANVMGSTAYRAWVSGTENRLELIGALFIEAQGVANRPGREPA